MDTKWYGFDFDGTLAIEDYSNLQICGVATPLLDLMRQYINEGKKVKIFTARTPEYRGDIYAFLERNGLLDKGIEITSCKDGSLHRFYDDRAIGVVKNTGLTHEIIFCMILVTLEALLKTPENKVLVEQAKHLCLQALNGMELTK